MASIKNFGIQGVGSDVQFGKGGSRLVADATGNFRLVNSANTSNVRLTVSNAVAATDAVALGQLQAVADSVTANAAAQQALIDGLTSNAASQQTAINGLVSNSVAQQVVLDTLTANAASQYTDLQTLFANAVSQQTRLDALANSTSGASSALQSEVDAIEAAVGLKADGTFDTLAGTYVSGSTTFKGAVEALDAALVAANAASVANAVAQQVKIDANTKAISDEVTRATGAEADLSTRITNEVTRATDAESAIANSVYIETVRAQGAESTISNAVTAEISRAMAAESMISNAVTAETTRATGVEGGLRTDLDALSSKVTNLGNVFEYKGTISDTDLTKIASPGIGDYYKVATAGTYTGANGFSIVLNLNDGLVYNGTDWDKIDNTDSAVFGTADFVAVTGSADVGYTVDLASSFKDRLTAVEGKTGVDSSSLQSQINDLRSNATAESARIDGVDAAQNAALAMEANARSAGDTLNAQAISDEANARTAADTLLTSNLANAVADYQAADALLRTDLNAEITRATGAEAAIISNVSSLLANAVSQQTAIDSLFANADAQHGQIVTLQGNVASLFANAVSQEAEIQDLYSKINQTGATAGDEIDRVEASVGLNTDGTLPAFTGNYTSGSNSVIAAIESLDTSLFNTNADLATETADRTAAVNAANAAISAETDRAMAAEAAANAAVAAEALRAQGVESSLLSAIGNTNSNVSTLSGVVSVLQSEVDATQAGAGLGTDGSYTANATANYISTATSLKNADDLLDAALKSENAARVAADNVQDSRLSALEANTATSSTAIQAELDAVETAVGLNSDGTYKAATGSNYVDSATSVSDAISKLDTALHTEALAQVANAAAQQTKIDSNTAAISQEVLDRANAVSNAVTLLQGEISSNVATINSTISSVNAAYQAADTLINANVAALSANVVLKDGSVAFTGDINAGSHKLVALANGTVSTDAVNKGQLDSAIASVQQNVASLGNAFNYVGTLTGGTANAATDLSTLPASGKDTGDYYKVTTAGYFTYNAVTSYFNVNDGLVFNSLGGFDKIDNTDSTVAGTANFVAVSGSADTGFTVDIDSAFKSRVSNAESAVSTLQSNAAAQQGLIVGLQTEVDAVETSVGLNSDGTITLGTANYFGSATTLLAALKGVDGQVKTNTDGLAAEITRAKGIEAGLQTELDATQTGAGLAANGAYVANASTTYIANATSLADADSKLDAAVKAVQTGLATLSQDKIVSTGAKYEVVASDAQVGFLANVGSSGSFATVGNVVTSASQDSTFTLSTAQAGQIRLEAHSSTAANVDIRLVPQGTGQVVVGETGTNGVIQADNGYDLTLAGGDQTGGTAGNVILHGGQGTTNGSVIVKDGSGNSILSLNTADVGVNATLNTTATQVVLGAAGSATNVDVKLAPKGTGSVDASSAKIVNVANGVAATDAVNVSQLQSAVSSAQTAATTGSLRAKTISVTETTASTPVVANVSGEAVRVKVYVTTAFTSGASISVVASSAGTLASSSMIDEATVGLYVIEVAPGTTLSNETISVNVTAGSGSTGIAKAFVEYISA